MVSYNQRRRRIMPDGLGTAPAKLDAKRIAASQPSPVHEDEILDWDCALETPPPPQRSGRIEVTLRRSESGPSAV